MRYIDPQGRIIGVFKFHSGFATGTRIKGARYKRIDLHDLPIRFTRGMAQRDLDQAARRRGLMRAPDYVQAT